MPSNGDGDARRPRAGTVLVASPRLLDPNFMHAVVLLCEHGPAGTFGLVLNRPTQLTVGELGSELDLLADRTDRLWTGGPVAPTELHVLHGAGEGIPGALPVGQCVWIGGDPAVLHAALAKGGEVRFFSGYSGWGPGQLEQEMEEASWVVCPSNARTVFDPRPETLWRRVLRAQGGAIAGLADLPPDASWN